MKFNSALIGFFAFLLAVSVSAQQITATLVGSVTDSQGALLAGASVKASNVDTGLTRSVPANDQGQYRLGLLPIGNYTVEVKATGFKTFLQKNVVLTVGMTQTVDAKLVIGSAVETVEVNTSPTLINTSTSEIGRTVEPKEIIGLPLVNRNVYSLLSLVPGAQANLNTISGGLGFPGQQTNINGGTGVDVSYYLDGALNMTMLRMTGNINPNPDAIQEFRVNTSNYDAEFGRFASGVVSVVTKSGTDTFHGSLFEFLRNTNLNAIPYLSHINPPYHRNQFGGTLGGPIVKNKVFFFGSYSGLRQTTNSQLTGAILPTAEERAGNFHDSAVQPLDPLTGKPFSYNGISGQIDPARLDPTAQNILKAYVPSATNLRGGFLVNGQYQAFIPNLYNTDEYLAKIDHQINQNQRLTATYFYTNGFNNANAGANVPYTDVEYAWTQQNAILSHVWTLNPNTINQAWVTYTRNFGGRDLTPSGSLAALGSSFTIQGTPALPQIGVSGYFSLNQAFWGPIAGTDFYSVRDLVNVNRGRHAMVFGGEVSMNKDFELTNLQNYGAFSFSGVKTRAASNNTNGYNPSIYKGNALADFVLGLPVSMEQDTASMLYTNTWNTGIFFQDNYRIRPTLTLNLGVRYDVQTPPTDPQNRGLVFTPGVQSVVVPTAPVGLRFIGDKGITRGIIPLPMNHVSPRFGLAWDPFGNGKTSVRAGAGLFFGGISGQEWDLLQASQPFIIRQQFNNIASLTNVYGKFPGGASPFPYNYSPSNPRFIAPSTVYTVDPHFHWPYSYQLSASVQQQLSSNIAFEIAYVGALNHNLLSIRDTNYPVYAPGATSTTVDQRRSFDTGLLSAINTDYSDQTASYHALQLSLTKRASRGLTLHSFYVWSHNFSSSSINGSQGGTAQNASIVSEDRGRDDYDLRHMFSFSAVWDIDYYHGTNNLLKVALNGWQISPIVSLQSGPPLNFGAGIDFNADGAGTDRPNLTGVNPVLGGHRARETELAAWFNKAAFCNYNPNPSSGPACIGIGPYGVDGSTPRNYIDGPGDRDVDLGLFRTFHLFERLNLQARAEATNAFNLVNIGNPNTTYTSGNFGKITSGGAMRQIQLGARLTF